MVKARILQPQTPPWTQKSQLLSTCIALVFPAMILAESQFLSTMNMMTAHRSSTALPTCLCVHLALRINTMNRFILDLAPVQQLRELYNRLFFEAQKVRRLIIT
jgi:hypothetical protein